MEYTVDLGVWVSVTAASFLHYQQSSSNVRSSHDELDELDMWTKFKREVKETCLLIFTGLSESDGSRTFQ